MLRLSRARTVLKLIKSVPNRFGLRGEQAVLAISLWGSPNLINHYIVSTDAPDDIGS